jgi:hypothetical protein
MSIEAMKQALAALKDCIERIDGTERTYEEIALQVRCYMEDVVQDYLCEKWKLIYPKNNTQPLPAPILHHVRAAQNLEYAIAIATAGETTGTPIVTAE